MTKEARVPGRPEEKPRNAKAEAPTLPPPKLLTEEDMDARAKLSERAPRSHVTRKPPPQGATEETVVADLRRDPRADK
jgi:hypothetical protein